MPAQAGGVTQDEMAEDFGGRATYLAKSRAIFGKGESQQRPAKKSERKLT